MTECIVFDLDGTLVKSHKTIYKSTIRTLERLDLSTELDETKFYNLLGHHFADIFKACNIDVPDVEYFIKIYKDIYFDFIDESTLYDNAIPVLQELKNQNIKTGLLTTKGHDQAVKISKYFNLERYLDSIEGRKNGVAIKPAPDQFIKICEDHNVNPARSIMIGDTELDILCGKAAGAKTIAVSFGYRDTNDVKKYEPDFIIDDLQEILNII